MQDIEAQLAKKKAAADSSLKFDDYYTALSQYVSAVTSSELAPTADQLLQEATRLLAAGDWQRAAALEAVGQLLHGPQSSTIGQGIHAACMDESAKAEQSVIVAALTGALASEPTTVPASLAGIASNLALCATHLRLWPQVLVSSLAACLFSEPLRAKNVARYAVAARHLGVKVDVPVQFMDESLSTLLNRIEKELFGKYDFAAFAKGGAANVPLAEYRGSFTVQKSQGRGFGLFAKAAFAVGDVVLCEHAVGYSNLSDDTDGSAALARLRQSTELGCTGFEMRRVIHVYDGTPRSDDAINDADFADLVGVPAFVPLRFFTPEVAPQTLEHLSGVITYNAYTGEHYVEQAPSDWLSIGLFPTSALINHDVRPNVTRQCVGRFLIFRTLRPINVGDEILGTYVAASAYLADDNLLQRWGVVEVARAPEVKKLRALDDCLGASIEKLVPFMEASSSGLLSAVEPPTRAAFICNAGLFAAIARLDNHPALQALVDLLSTGQPELSLLEQCCKIIAKFERKMNKDTVKRLRALLEQWCDVCLGHRNLVAAASRRVT